MTFDKNVVTENSFLTLNTHDHLMNRAYAKNSPRTIQYFVDISSLGTDKNQRYQFQYNGFFTRCISVDASPRGANFGVEEALQTVLPLKKLGPTVTLVSNNSGLQLFQIDFDYSPSYPLKIITESGLCSTAATSAIVYLKPSSSVTYTYPIQSGSGVVLKAKNTISAGTYNVTIPYSNGISVNKFGIRPNSFTMTHWGKRWPHLVFNYRDESRRASCDLFQPCLQCHEA